MVRQAYGCARNDCGRLARLLQIKDDEWAPYASMRSCICLDGGQCTHNRGGRDSGTDIDRDESIGEPSLPRAASKRPFGAWPTSFVSFSLYCSAYVGTLQYGTMVLVSRELCHILSVIRQSISIINFPAINIRTLL